MKMYFDDIYIDKYDNDNYIFFFNFRRERRRVGNGFVFIKEFEYRGRVWNVVGC